jgi:hypothetical protein
VVLKDTVCLGFLSTAEPRQTSTSPHTPTPQTKFTNPPEAQKFSEGRKIPSGIQHSKSLPPPRQALPRGPSRISDEIPQSSALAAAEVPRRASTPRVFPKGPLSCSGVTGRELLRFVIGGPPRAGRARALLRGNAQPRVERRCPAPFRLRCLTGTGVAWGGDPPGRGSISLLASVSNPSLVARISGSSLCHEGRAEDSTPC